MYFGLSSDDEENRCTISKADVDQYNQLIKHAMYELKPLKPTLFVKYANMVFDNYQNKPFNEITGHQFKTQLLKFRSDLYRYETPLLHRKGTAALTSTATVVEEKLTEDIDYSTKSINRSYKINNNKQNLF